MTDHKKPIRQSPQGGRNKTCSLQAAAQQVRGDLSGGAWWSSEDSRLATPEGPAGAHSAPCVIEGAWLLPLAGLTRAEKAGLWGFANPRSTVGAGLQDEDVQDVGRGLVQAAASTRAGGHLGVYLSIAEERNKMIGRSTCRGMGGGVDRLHACVCLQASGIISREQDEEGKTCHTQACWINRILLRPLPSPNRAHAGAERG